MGEQLKGNIMPIGLPKDPYSLEHLGNVIEAMDFLRKEAKKSGVEEITQLVDSAFQIVYTTYYAIMRYDMASLPKKNLEQSTSDSTQASHLPSND